MHNFLATFSHENFSKNFFCIQDIEKNGPWVVNGDEITVNLPDAEREGPEPTR